MKKKWILLGMITVLVLALAGCGKKDSDQKDGDTDKGKEEVSDGGDGGEYRLAEYVKLGEYKGMEYTEVNLEVTDEELAAAVTKFISEHPVEEKITDRAVADGDMVSISYIGYEDGEAFEGGTGTAEDLVIGSNSMIPGFEDGIIGVMPGDTVSVDATFPEEYRPEGTAGSEMNGKAVVFDITVNHIVEKKDAVYTDDFVKENSDYATIKEFEENLLSTLVEEKKKNAEDAKLDEIFSQVMENAEILEVPEEEYQKYYDNLVRGYQSMADSTGMELSEFLLAYYGATEDNLAEYAGSYADNMASQAVVFQAIAKAEGLTVTDEEYQEGADSYFESMGSDYESKEAFEKEMGELIRESLLYDKVMQFVVDQAVAVPAQEAGSDAAGGTSDEKKDDSSNTDDTGKDSGKARKDTGKDGAE